MKDTVRIAIRLTGALLTAALLCAIPGCDRGKKQSKPAPAVKVSVADQAKAVQLVGRIKDPSEAVRRDAFRGLAELGPRAEAAIPGLMTAMVDKDPRVAMTAAQVLGRIGAAAVDPLIKILEASSDPVEMAGAAKALGEVGPGAENALPTLLPLLEDWNSGVRSAAAIAVGQIRAASGSEAIVKSFTMEEGTTADFARAILPGSGSGVSGHVQSVNPSPGQQRQLLEQFIPTHNIGPLGDEGKRKAVVTISVGGGAGKAAEVIPPLVKMLEEDEMDECRAAAAQALGRIGPGAADAIKPLIRALWDEDVVAGNAAWALGEMGPRGKEAIPHLQQALRNGSGASQAAAAITKLQKED